MDERQPWERQTGESTSNFSKFEMFRLMGVGRSVLEVANQIRDGKGHKRSHSTPGYLRKNAEKWRWRERAEAWDRHLLAEKEAAIQAAEAAWKKKIMGPSETLARLSDHGRNDMREFFKIGERWSENPAPTEEIIGEEVRTVIRNEEEIDITFYRVRKIVFDVDALLDPQKSHRVKKFVDSPRSGLGVELYNADDAVELMAKHHKLLTDTVDVNMYANAKGYQNVSPDDWDADEDVEGGEDEDAPPEP